MSFLYPNLRHFLTTTLTLAILCSVALAEPKGSTQRKRGDGPELLPIACEGGIPELSEEGDKATVNGRTYALSNRKNQKLILAFLVKAEAANVPVSVYAPNGKILSVDFSGCDKFSLRRNVTPQVSKGAYNYFTEKELLTKASKIMLELLKQEDLKHRFTVSAEKMEAIEDAHSNSLVLPGFNPTGSAAPTYDSQALNHLDLLPYYKGYSPKPGIVEQLTVGSRGNLYVKVAGMKAATVFRYAKYESPAVLEVLMNSAFQQKEVQMSLDSYVVKMEVRHMGLDASRSQATTLPEEDQLTPDFFQISTVRLKPVVVVEKKKN